MTTSSPSPSPSPSPASAPSASVSGPGSADSGAGAGAGSRRGSTSSTPRTLSPIITPSQSRRHSIGHIHTSPKPSSRSTSPSRQPTSGEYDMALIGGAPLTITLAASGVTPIAPGPPVKSTGSTTRRVAPRVRPSPNPNPNPSPPSPTHKKLSSRPPVEHKPDDLLRSWRRDETRSPSPQSTQDDTKMIPSKEQKMTNVHYTRGRRGSIDDIVISHHTDESATNVEIATSPIKKQQRYEFTYPASPSSQQQQQQDIQSSIKKSPSSPIKDDIPMRPPSRTRTSSGTKSAGSSPYISATRPSGVAPSALLLASTPPSSSSPRLRWLLRILILTLTCLAIYSYLSGYTITIVMTWLLLIPVSIYIVLQFHTTSPPLLPSPSISHDSPLLKHSTRRRSSLPGIQTLSARTPITPTSTPTSTSTSHDIPNVLLTRKPATTPTADDKPHRTKLPMNVFHTS